MSVKAMSLVWDVPCPSQINGLEFKPGHKYVLIAYADHADQTGRNIYPAVETISRKTGYVDRSVQLLTRELEQMGLLVDDGSGPRGTNRWYIPFSQGGEKISPLKNLRGEIDEKSLGEIPSGEIPSGANISPELRNRNPEYLSLYNKRDIVWGDIKTNLKQEMPKAQFETWVESSIAVDFDGRTLKVATKNTYAKDWLDGRVKDKAQNISGYFVEFVTEGYSTVEAVPV